VKRLALLIGAVAALLALLPAAAFAHATLEQTSPERGAVARTAPRQVVLRFDESVEGNFGAVRVFDGNGDRVDDGHTIHPGGTGAQLAVGLRSGLRDGTYTTTYRVISADSHPVSGGFVFSIGRAGVAPSETVSDLLKGAQVGKVTETAFGIARGADYLAIALVIGTLLFILLAWPRADGAPGPPLEAQDAFARRATVLLWSGALIGVLAGLAGLVLQGATASGTTFWSSLGPSTVREVLGTRFGTVWGLRILDFAIVGGLAMTWGAPLRRSVWPYAIPAAYLAVAPALGGHATTQHPVALLAPLDVIHVLAMSAWVGGLVVLLAAVPAATRAIPDATARTPLLSAALSRFSVVALTCVALLIATGTAQSIVHLRSFGDFLHTAFGRAVLIKIILLVALIGLGALNRQRSVPRLRAAARDGGSPGATGRILRNTLRAEVGLVVIVLAVTSALVSYAPPTALSAGPYSHSATTGPLQIELTVDPARAGENAVHLYIFNARDGSPFDGTKELDVSAQLPSKGIGPLPATLNRAGPGHYVANAMSLAPGGKWTVTVTDRVSDFDEYTTTFRVPVS
jgi:copper transport protein